MTAHEQASADLLVVVAVSGQTLAVPAATVAEMVHEPALVRPPRLPAVVEGLFRLRGRVVPVLRCDLLLSLPPPPPGPFRVLLVFHQGWAMLVERALAVVQAAAATLAPVPAGHSLGECVVALYVGEAGAVPVLAPDRLMQRREALAVAELGRWAEQRWEDFALGHP